MQVNVLYLVTEAGNYMPVKLPFSLSMLCETCVVLCRKKARLMMLIRPSLALTLAVLL